MILDIVAIVFIIGLSFILCMKDNNYNCQLSHIVIGLSVMVFYKLARVLKLKNANEGFDNNTNSLADFLSGNAIGSSILTPNQAQTLSPSELVNYNNKLDSLINALSNLNNQNNSSQINLSSSPDNIQKLDLESQQQYQMFQIDYLNKQLQNAKDIINAQTITNNNSNYKPIKVYSSCIVSNADGTTSIDKPITSSKNNILATNPDMGNALGTGASTDTSTGMNGYRVNQQTSGLPGSNMIGNNLSSNQSNFMNLSPSTGIFNDFITKLGNGQGNINVNLN